MTTIRLTVNRKTKAQLEYLATIAGTRTAELAEDYLKRKASEEFEDSLQTSQLREDTNGTNQRRPKTNHRQRHRADPRAQLCRRRCE